MENNPRSRAIAEDVFGAGVPAINKHLKQGGQTFGKDNFEELNRIVSRV